MMACVADKLVVAPFAMLGSIGVVGGMPNFSKVLKKRGVDYFHFTAGETTLHARVMFGSAVVFGGQASTLGCDKMSLYTLCLPGSEANSGARFEPSHDLNWVE